MRARYAAAAATSNPAAAAAAIGNLLIENQLLLINYDITRKSDTVQLWRISLSICVQSLIAIGCEMEKF